MPDFPIRVVIDPVRAKKGAEQVNRNLSDIEKRADRLQGTLTNIFSFAAVGFGIAQVARLADEYQNYQNRLRAVIPAQGQLAEISDELLRIANETRTAFGATAEVYARTALSARDLGLTQGEVLRFTERLNKAIVLSGASGEEARAGLIQFSQGLASGALRGDELRSVLEQLPIVADVLARELGVTRGELRQLGSEGRITSDIILRAFENADEELSENFAKTIPTISQAFTVLRNNFVAFIGEQDQATGATRSFSRLLLGLAGNMGTLAEILRIVAPLLAGLAVGATLRFFQTLIVLVKNATLAMVGLNATTKLNPFIALASIAASLAVAFGLWQEEITGVDSSLGKLSKTAGRNVDVLTQLDVARAKFGLGIDVLTGQVNDAKLAAESYAIQLEQVERVIDGLGRGQGTTLGVLLRLAPELETSDLVAQVREQIAAVRETIEGDERAIVSPENVLLTPEQLGQFLPALRARAAEFRRLYEQFAPPAGTLGKAEKAIEKLIGRIEIERTAIALSAESQAAANIVRSTGVNLLELDLEARQRLIPTLVRQAEALEREKTAREAIGQLTEQLQSIQEERRLIGLTASERARAIELRRAEQLAIAAGRDDLLALLPALEQELIAQERAARSLSSGIRQVVASVREEAEDTASVVGSTFDAVFSQGQSAIAKFLRGSTVSFEEFANAILDDLAQIYARMLLIQALNFGFSALGLPGSAAAGLVGGGIGGGGGAPTTGGFDIRPALPREAAPAIQGSTAPAIGGPEPVRVTILNVTDPRDVPAGIDGPDGDRAIMNVIRRNKTAIRNITS